MNNKEKNVYIACSMIKAKQLDFSLLDILIEFTKSQGYNPFVPGKMEDASSKEIFERDMNWLRNSSKIIADVNEPSHGVGMEIMYAYQNEIPIICLLNEKNKPLSRMVEGSPNTVVLMYHSKNEIEEKLYNFELDKTKILFCSECNEKTIHLDKKCLKC